MGYLVFYFGDVCGLLLVLCDVWCETYEEVEWGLSGGCAGP
jgi:hypothetical protein